MCTYNNMKMGRKKLAIERFGRYGSRAYVTVHESDNTAIPLEPP